MTLARQMYPGHIEYFMKLYNRATKDPYGHLFVDLKPFTPEYDRLKRSLKWRKGSMFSELTNQDEVPAQTIIKEAENPDTNHYSVGTQTVNIRKNTAENISENTCMSEKINACDDCGILFDTPHDVQRHLKRGQCYENDEPERKKRK